MVEDPETPAASSARADSDRTAKLREVEELWRYEEERRERRLRRNRISWRFVWLFLTVALGWLSYDSAQAAQQARHDGEPWLYPACVAGAAVLGALLCLVLTVRRRRRGGRRWPADDEAGPAAEDPFAADDR